MDENGDESSLATDGSSFKHNWNRNGDGNIYLQIAKWGFAGATDPHDSELFALILEPTGGIGEYRRIGIARIPEEDGIAEIGWEIRTVRIV
jgi:hypothetical protein